MVMVGVAAALAVALVIAVVYGLKSRDADPTAASTSTSTGTESDPSAPDAEPTGDAQASDTANPEPTTEPTTCWDGSAAAVVTDCPDLTGSSGMRWVFPSMAATFDTCSPARIYDGKLNAQACRVRLPGGGLSGATYSEFSSAALAESHYVAKYGEGRRDGDRLVFGPAQTTGSQWQMSVTFADGRRWSATAAGPTAAKVRQTISAIRMRSIADMDAQVGPPPP